MKKRKKLKRILALILVIVMIIPTGSVFGATTYSNGSYVLYGTYPSEKVTDTELIAKLNAIEADWVTYDWYESNQYAEMGKYKDVALDGMKYRAVYLSDYRPEYVTWYTWSTNSCQPDNGYKTGTVYWFKYQPVSWTVIDASQGLLMTSAVIDAQPYTEYYEYVKSIEAWGYYGDPGHTYYASSYYQSYIKRWLTNDFYNTVFNDSQKANIKTFSWTLDSYTGMTFTDKVYLLRRADINKTGLFSTYYDKEDENRCCPYVTDYALAMGAKNTGTTRATYPYFLQDATGKSTYYGTNDCIDETGVLYEEDSKRVLGVRPAIRLNVIKDDYSQLVCDHSGGRTTIPGYEAGCYTTGKTDGEKCAVCGEIFTARQTIPVLNHTPGNEEVVYTREATCAQEGLYNYTCYCARCGEMIGSGTDIPIAKKDHEYVWETTPATTTADGVTVAFCKYCNGEREEFPIDKISNITLSGTAFLYNGAVKKPTVTGVKTKTLWLQEGRDYKVTYSNAQSKEIGAYTLKIDFLGDYSGSKTYTYTIGPKATKITSVTNAVTGVTVKWAKDATVTGYKIYRSTNGGAYVGVKKITSNATVSYNDTAANTNGAEYRYKVYTYKTVNGVECNGASAVSEICEKVATPIVTVSNVATGVKVSWTDRTGIFGYAIYRKKVGDTSWTRLATLYTPVSSYIDKTAVSNGNYYYTARALRINNDVFKYSAFVSSKAIKYLKTPSVALANVTGGIKVTWTKTTGATSYAIYRKTASTGWARIYTASSTATTYTDKTAKKGVKYYYTVKAINGNYASSFVTNKYITKQ